MIAYARNEVIGPTKLKIKNAAYNATDVSLIAKANTIPEYIIKSDTISKKPPKSESFDALAVIVKLKGTINVRLKGTTHESEKINEKNGNLSLLYLINKRLLNDMYSNVYNSINLVQAR